MGGHKQDGLVGVDLSEGKVVVVIPKIVGGSLDIMHVLVSLGFECCKGGFKRSNLPVG